MDRRKKLNSGLDCRGQSCPKRPTESAKNAFRRHEKKDWGYFSKNRFQKGRCSRLQ